MRFAGFFIPTMTIKVSPEDAQLLAGHHWHVNPQGYVVRYTQHDYKRCLVALHRVVAGAGPGDVVDHANGDKTDNRRENLRLCTHAENMRNRKTARTNKLGVKGVYLDGRRNKYRAEIKHDGRRHCLGTFDDIDAARLAYAAASERLHGEFGRTA
jgi:hypothetical protein